MALRIKSIRQENILGINLVYEDNTFRQVALIEMPPDGDWRADMEFYDSFKEIYAKRLSSAYKHIQK